MPSLSDLYFVEQLNTIYWFMPFSLKFVIQDFEYSHNNPIGAENIMDSDSDENLSDGSDSTISSSELDNSSSEDNDSLIEGLDQNSIDEWQWKIDNSRFSTSCNYFDGHALGKNIIRPIDSFSKFIRQDMIKLIIDQTNI